jgi:adenylate kinase
VIPGARLILLGRQGAGKGTQCVRLARHYVVPHVSTGDILRAAVKEGTDLGLKAKALMDAGELVSDDVIIGVVDDRLARNDAVTRGYILDGFPRTVGQAVALIDITSKRPIDVVIDLEVPRELVMERISSRRMCTDCGSNYSLSNRPKRDWVCDFCGGDVVQRDDDTEEAILRRLELYDTQTSPLIEFYERRGELVVVDGVGHPDEVTARLVKVIDARRSRRP